MDLNQLLSILSQPKNSTEIKRTTSACLPNKEILKKLLQTVQVSHDEILKINATWLIKTGYKPLKTHMFSVAESTAFVDLLASDLTSNSTIHILQISDKLCLNKTSFNELENCATHFANSTNRFLKAWSMNTYIALCRFQPPLIPEYIERAQLFLNKSPAEIARAKAVLKELNLMHKKTRG